VRCPSDTELIIFELLSDDSEKYGLELVQKSNGELKRGSVYVFLSRMQSENWIIGRIDKIPGDSGSPRVKYRLSPKGRHVLKAMRQLQTALEEEDT